MKALIVLALFIPAIVLGFMVSVTKHPRVAHNLTVAQSVATCDILGRVAYQAGVARDMGYTEASLRANIRKEMKGELDGDLSRTIHGSYELKSQTPRQLQDSRQGSCNDAHYGQ